jgi:hypothetical protein
MLTLLAGNRGLTDQRRLSKDAVLPLGRRAAQSHPTPVEIGRGRLSFSADPVRL